jgi:hypothetical protein
MLWLAPVFTLLDRPTGESTVGVEDSYVEYGHMSFTGSGMRGEAHAEVVDPGTGLGGYLRAPFAHLFDNGYGYSGTAFDDIELGGVLRLAGRHGFEVVMHAGAAVSTAGEDADHPRSHTRSGRAPRTSCSRCLTGTPRGLASRRAGHPDTSSRARTWASM